jgi:hypothetical protein
VVGILAVEDTKQDPQVLGHVTLLKKKKRWMGSQQASYFKYIIAIVRGPRFVLCDAWYNIDNLNKIVYYIQCNCPSTNAGKPIMLTGTVYICTTRCLNVHFHGFFYLSNETFLPWAYGYSVLEWAFFLSYWIVIRLTQTNTNQIKFQ